MSLAIASCTHKSVKTETEWSSAGFEKFFCFELYACLLLSGPVATTMSMHKAVVLDWFAKSKTGSARYPPPLGG